MGQDIEIAGWKIDDATTLKKRFEHCGLPIEVTNHGRRADRELRGEQGTYCYYVVVSEQMMPPSEFTKFWLEPQSYYERASGLKTPCYAYSEAAFAQVDWHCGVTYYEKLGGIDGQSRYVKIGCDYGHYWDEGHYYTLEDVCEEAMRTAEQLSARFNFYRRCPWFGTYQPVEEMVEVNGTLWSAKGAEQRLAERAK